MPQILAMFRARDYSFISLEEALKDPAYALPDEYTGTGGFSWIHRWAMAKKLSSKPMKKKRPIGCSKNSLNVKNLHSL